MKSICVYCGSSVGRNGRYVAAARALGAAIAEKSITLVYGGATVGLMGAVAGAVLEGGGRVIGVIPRSIAALGVAATGQGELRLVDSMHERKALMADLADAFIALPGGIGTVEETFEIFTARQLGLTAKPLGLLNTERFYDPLFAFLDHMVAEGFLRHEHRESLVVDDDPRRLIDALEHYKHRPVDKWFDVEKNRTL